MRFDWILFVPGCPWCVAIGLKPASCQEHFQPHAKFMLGAVIHKQNL
jgi:hypothetical protein